MQRWLFFEFIVDNICVYDSSFVQNPGAINVLGFFNQNMYYYSKGFYIWCWCKCYKWILRSKEKHHNEIYESTYGNYKSHFSKHIFVKAKKTIPIEATINR
jgi:hypothetical protein